VTKKSSRPPPPNTHPGKLTIYKGRTQRQRVQRIGQGKVIGAGGQRASLEQAIQEKDSSSVEPGPRECKKGGNIQTQTRKESGFEDERPAL